MTRSTRIRFKCLLVFLVAVTVTRADLIPFGLDGNGGLGLLAANVNGTVTGTFGSGGLGIGGITLDTIANTITIDVVWGSGNGFLDLTGNATAVHIHLATAAPAPTGFTQNAGPSVFLSSLPGYNSNAVNGGFNGVANLSGAQQTAILNEQSYINVHTGTNGGGEIRCHLVVIPEPGSVSLLLSGAGVLLYIRRRYIA